MGRKLMRVPLDFNWPLDRVWKGYDISNVFPDHSCEKCNKIHNDCREDADYCLCYNPAKKKEWYYDPPTGDGYQLWETTTEGSPITPVFKSLDELCTYLEKEGVSWFGSLTATKEQWKQGLDDGTAGLLIMQKVEG